MAEAFKKVRLFAADELLLNFPTLRNSGEYEKHSVWLTS
jgi:hypothetical protein